MYYSRKNLCDFLYGFSDSRVAAFEYDKSNAVQNFPAERGVLYWSCGWVANS
jgi:hypothetical protein